MCRLVVHAFLAIVRGQSADGHRADARPFRYDPQCIPAKGPSVPRPPAGPRRCGPVCSFPWLGDMTKGSTSLPTLMDISPAAKRMPPMRDICPKEAVPCPRCLAQAKRRDEVSCTIAQSLRDDPIAKNTARRRNCRTRRYADVLARLRETCTTARCVARRAQSERSSARDVLQ